MKMSFVFVVLFSDVLCMQVVVQGRQLYFWLFFLSNQTIEKRLDNDVFHTINFKRKSHFWHRYQHQTLLQRRSKAWLGDWRHLGSFGAWASQLVLCQSQCTKMCSVTTISKIAEPLVFSIRSCPACMLSYSPSRGSCSEEIH